MTNYDAKSRQARINVLKMIYQSKNSHIGSCFSVIDILVALYYKVLNISPSNPTQSDRDYLILSKGHASAALYAILADLKFFEKKRLDSFCADGSILGGHVTYGIPGVEFSSGSLGHGLSVSCGLALNGKRKKETYRIFTILSDGENDEGSVWEAALFAAQHRLDNLTVIIDYNKIQAFGRTNEVINLEPFRDKWEAFGWKTIEINGHDHHQLINILSTCPLVLGKPTCVIAHTVKGKGVSFMENKLEWHYNAPTKEQYDLALNELEGSV